MKRSFLAALESRRATIRHFWDGALRRLPVSTPLGNPDTLVYMMDETLDQLFTLVRGKSLRQWAGVYPADHLKIGQNCRCGFNPLVAYFLAGESALVSTARLIKPDATLIENDLLVSQKQLLFAFRVLAHREVNSFCDICVIAHTPDTAKQETTAQICPWEPLVEHESG